MCAGQGEWNSQRKGTLMPGIHMHRHRHRHTLHPDLTRLVNHLSRGQGNGQTPLSSVRPPSLLLYLSLHLLLYSFIVSVQGQLSFSTDINLVNLTTCFYLFFPLSACLCFCLSHSFPPTVLLSHTLYNAMSTGLSPSC